MPPIVISAVITDGSSVLLERLPGGGGLRLPRYDLGDEETIEDALATHLFRDLGISVVEQEFIDTVYEQASNGAEIVLNNLQLITAWEGVPERAASGPALVPTPAEQLGDAGLAPEVLDLLATALGLGRASALTLGAATTGRIVLLTAAGAPPSAVAWALCDALGGAALLTTDGLAGTLLVGAASSGMAPEAALRLGIANAAALARNFSASGIDVVIAAPRQAASYLPDMLTLLEPAELYAINLAGAPDSYGPGGWQIGDFGGIDLAVGGMLANVEGLSAADAAAVLIEGLDAARVM
jgi:hypothetical protein